MVQGEIQVDRRIVGPDDGIDLPTGALAVALGGAVEHHAVGGEREFGGHGRLAGFVDFGPLAAAGLDTIALQNGHGALGDGGL